MENCVFVFAHRGSRQLDRGEGFLKILLRTKVCYGRCARILALILREGCQGLETPSFHLLIRRPYCGLYIVKQVEAGLDITIYDHYMSGGGHEVHLPERNFLHLLNMLESVFSRATSHQAHFGGQEKVVIMANILRLEEYTESYRTVQSRRLLLQRRYTLQTTRRRRGTHLML